MQINLVTLNLCRTGLSTSYQDSLVNVKIAHSSSFFIAQSQNSSRFFLYWCGLTEVYLALLVDYLPVKFRLILMLNSLDKRSVWSFVAVFGWEYWCFSNLVLQCGCKSLWTNYQLLHQFFAQSAQMCTQIEFGRLLLRVEGAMQFLGHLVAWYTAESIFFIFYLQSKHCLPAAAKPN